MSWFPNFMCHGSVKIMTSSNGNFFRVTGPWCGDFTGHRWIPLTKASDTEIWCFFDLRLDKRLNKQSRRRWFHTPSCSLWRHCYAMGFRDRCQHPLYSCRFILKQVSQKHKGRSDTCLWTIDVTVNDFHMCCGLSSCYWDHHGSTITGVMVLRDTISIGGVYEMPLKMWTWFGGIWPLYV